MIGELPVSMYYPKAKMYSKTYHLSNFERESVRDWERLTEGKDVHILTHQISYSRSHNKIIVNILYRE